jgi:hypothetical protein
MTIACALVTAATDSRNWIRAGATALAFAAVAVLIGIAAISIGASREAVAAYISDIGANALIASAIGYIGYDAHSIYTKAVSYENMRREALYRRMRARGEM